MKYFLHDTASFEDEKISELFINFGYEGLGLFYTLIEKMARQEKPIKTNVLKHQCKVGKRLEKCWDFMEEIDLISSNNGETFNKQLLNFAQKYQIKKEKNAKRISQWREKQVVTENVTHSENVRNTPKVKKSKSNIYMPDIDEVIKYFLENGFKADAAKNAYKYYNESGWVDSNGKKVLNWKQKMRGVWFRDENKINTNNTLSFNIPVN
jgi:hypothetical protein